jgi:hypothetical protein
LLSVLISMSIFGPFGTPFFAHDALSAAKCRTVCPGGLGLRVVERFLALDQVVGMPLAVCDWNDSEITAPISEAKSVSVPPIAGLIMAPPRDIDERDIDRLLAGLTDRQIADLFDMTVPDVSELRRLRKPKLTSSGQEQNKSSKPKS